MPWDSPADILCVDTFNSLSSEERVATGIESVMSSSSEIYSTATFAGDSAAFTRSEDFYLSI